MLYKEVKEQIHRGRLDRFNKYPQEYSTSTGFVNSWFASDDWKKKSCVDLILTDWLSKGTVECERLDNMVDCRKTWRDFLRYVLYFYKDHIEYADVRCDGTDKESKKRRKYFFRDFNEMFKENDDVIGISLASMFSEKNWEDLEGNTSWLEFENNVSILELIYIYQRWFESRYKNNTRQEVRYLGSEVNKGALGVELKGILVKRLGEVKYLDKEQVKYICSESKEFLERYLAGYDRELSIFMNSIKSKGYKGEKIC